MLSRKSAERRDLVMLAPEQKHPNPLSCELLEPKPFNTLLMSGPCTNKAPGKKLRPSFPAPLQCLKNVIQILHLEIT